MKKFRQNVYPGSRKKCTKREKIFSQDSLPRHEISQDSPVSVPFPYIVKLEQLTFGVFLPQF
jgi:hypothetical protein